jgi:nicotinate-nucleotide pyrophosphorylase (carboxylating)
VSRPPPAPLEPALYVEIVRRAIAEDLGWGDYTSDATVPAGTRARAVLLAKSPLVLAGIDVAFEAFKQLDPGVHLEALKQDGDACAAGECLARIEGTAASLLTAERTALNFLQRLSGIATLTRRFVEAAAPMTVLDTRKTTPTLRALEKYAARAGGARNHRGALDEGILIKDNHIRAAGGIAAALERMRAAGHELPIEIEAQSLSQVDEALAAGATWIMLDNMSDADIREAVARVAGRARLEISGGITLERVRQLADAGAETVSVGALTHSAPAADISLEIETIT